MNVKSIPDAEAPEDWIERHGDYLYRYALNRTRRTEAAEDLVQETFLAAWQGRAKFAGRSSLRTWLVSILRRKLVNRLRRSAKEKLATDIAGIDPMTDDLFDHRGRWRRPPGEWDDVHPETAGRKREFWEAVAGCVSKLPDRMRRAFVFRHLVEGEPAEACRELGVSANNLWVLLHRARLRLNQCLDRNWVRAGEQE